MGQHLTMEQLHAGLDEIRRSPRETGRLEMIVRRPAVGHREALTEAVLDLEVGLVGDTWVARGSTRTPDGTRHPDMQINLMNARAIALIAQERARWPLAGDQLFVDLDLSAANLPPGTRMGIGEAILEVTAQPHTGCAKFVERFG
ncbi:MAG: MOSC domain-containing protein, partial [Vicinamibacterales bacterium]